MDFRTGEERLILENCALGNLNSSKDATLEEESTCENQEYVRVKGSRSNKVLSTASKCRNKADCNQTISTIFELRLKLIKLEEGVNKNKLHISELEQEHSELATKKEVLHNKLKAKLKMVKQPKNFCCNLSNLFS